MHCLPLLILLLSSLGCSHARLLPTIPPGPTSRPEERALPQDGRTEKLPEGTPPGEWVEPGEADSCQPGCPARAGILMSEAKAARYAIFKIRYTELRTIFEADRDEWRASRAVYEGRMVAADDAIKSLQPTWLQQHGLELGFLGGFVVAAGGALTVLLLVR